MLKRVGWLVALAVLASGWQAATSQTSHQHQPPEASNAHTQALEDASRAEWQQPDEVIYRLNLNTGEEVADLGAGSGYFTIRLARAVEPDGRVYAVDTDPEMLKYIERRAEEEMLENIQTILADPDNPKLGSESVDLIFTCNVLHHISNRDRYYLLLARALRDGGRLVNIDFYKRKLPLGPPVEVKIAKRDVIKEAGAAGFRLVEDFKFLKYQYFLVFEH